MPDGAGADRSDPVERQVRVEKIRLEGGFLVDDGQPTSSSNYAQLVAAASQRSGSVELRLAGRLDGFWQTGEQAYSSVSIDYDESYLRLRGARYRVTAGAQIVAWGRTDEVSPVDRMSVMDFTRGVLDQLADRRRAVPALRTEAFVGSGHLDVLWIPWFRSAELPDRRSIWSPVNTREGRIFGLPESDALRALLARVEFDESEHGSGGLGGRFSMSAGALDAAFTVQRTRHSEPFYELDAAEDAGIRPTLIARHPWTWVVGADAAIDFAGATWRAECAYLSDSPVTRIDLRPTSVPAVDCVAGVEFYPGDGEVRTNLQIVAHHLVNPPEILELTDLISLNGQISADLLRQRWRALTRFHVGLDQRDLMLNLQVSYRGFEPHELYVSAIAFAGEDRTLGGFYEDNDMITVGWRARF